MAKFANTSPLLRHLARIAATERLSEQAQQRLLSLLVLARAVGVNRDGFRESLGLDVVTSEDGAAWLASLRSLVARGLAGVRLVTSDAQPGLVDAIAATLPGATLAALPDALAMRNLLDPRPAESAQ